MHENENQQNKYQPCILGLATVQELQQGGSQSIVLERGKNVPLDCMRFSSVGMHHHIPLENPMPCNDNNIFKLQTRRMFKKNYQAR